MDQQLACFPIMRRPVKAYKNICFYLLNLAIYNSFALYNKVRPPKPKEKRHYTDFRINLAEQLLMSSQLPNRTYLGQRTNAGQHDPMRLKVRNWAHYQLKSKNIDGEQFALQTVSIAKQGLNVPLHVDNECFKAYHS